MQSLFEIESKYLELMNEIEELEGEITPEIEKQLIINQNELKNKVSQYRELMIMIESDISAADIEIKRLQAFKQRKTNLISLLKDRLLEAVRLYGEDGKSGNKTLKFETISLYTRKTMPLVVPEDDKIFIEYLESAYPDLVRITKSVDKMAMKDVLKQGVDIPGAYIDDKKETVIIK